jgi:hypothetical protein
MTAGPQETEGGLLIDARSAQKSAATPFIGYGLTWSPQAALCSGGMVASASGEQLGLRSGMTWLLIAPILPGPGILCVPYIVMSFVGG